MSATDHVTVELNKPVITLELRMPRFYSLRLNAAAFFIRVACFVSGGLVDVEIREADA